MRQRRVVAVGIGMVVGASALGACSSDGGSEPFDAGTLPDVTTGIGEDASGPGDSATDARSDAGDATTGSDAPPGDGAAQGQDASAPDAPAAVDASDATASSFDAGDGAPSSADASDAASPSVDASDAASLALDAGDGAPSGDDAGGATSPFADSGPLADASDAGTNPVCVGYDPATNPIVAVVATDDGSVVAQPSSGSTDVSAAFPVVFAVTTAPAGLAQQVEVGYCTGTKSCASPSYVVLVLDVDAGGAGDAWSGPIPPLAAGTNVFWWVQAGDTCQTAQEHYWSNFGSDFEYTTQ